MTDQIVPWKGVFHYLANLAEARLSPAEYASAVQDLYYVLAEDTDDPTAAQKFLLSEVNSQLHCGAISESHCALVTELLPRPSVRSRGRPMGAYGGATYDKKYKLYAEWIYQKTLNPSFTKEQFAKGKLDITDEMLNGDRSDRNRKRLDALLQELKPARMRYLVDRI